MKVYLINKKERELLKESNDFKIISNFQKEFNITKSFCIGYLKNLMNSHSTYEEWVKGYFESGEERQSILKSLDSITKKANMDYDWFMNEGKVPKKAIFNYNSNFGRTREELGDFAVFLKEKLAEQGMDYSLELIYAVLYMNIVQLPWENKKEA